jgi:hypothetical protein
MFTSVPNPLAATRSRASRSIDRAMNLAVDHVDVTIPATWYAATTATFGHKHPSRRPPS